MKDRRKEIDNERSQLEEEVRKFEQLAKDDKRLWRRTSFPGACLVDRSRCWEAGVGKPNLFVIGRLHKVGSQSVKLFGENRD